MEGFPHRIRGIFCALVGGVFWGFSANCAEELMGVWGVPVGWITSMRLMCASAIFLAIAAINHRNSLAGLIRDRRNGLLTVAFALFGILLTQLSYLSAIGLAGAGTALLLEQLGLLLVMAYLCLKNRRKPYGRESAGLICALAGVFLIATQGDPSTLNIPAAGLAWGLVSAVALAFYNLLPDRPLARYGSVSVSGVAMLVAGIASVLWFRPWSMDVSLPFEGWAVFAAIVVVGTVGAYLFFLQGIKDAGPMLAGMLGSVEPVSAMVIGFFWKGTPVTFYDVLGAVAIAAMIALVAQRDCE